MKSMKVPSHKELMKPWLKNRQFRLKIKAGVQRLKVIRQIIDLREKLGLTQAELARRIGATQPFIAKIENNETANLSLETLVKIVEALSGEIEIHIRPSKRAA